jgi:hypothetical protein
MSKTKYVSNVSGTQVSQDTRLPGFNSPTSDAYLVYPWQVSNLQGRLLTFMETLGFDEKREKAVKDVIKEIMQEIYGHALYLPPEAAIEASKLHHKFIYDTVAEFEKGN